MCSDKMYLMLCCAKSLQSCPTLCDPIDGSSPGSSVPGILQARTLEWVAISFSNAWKWKVKVKSFSRVRLLATPWTAAYQAPLSMGFSRQDYWSWVRCISYIISLWIWPTFLKCKCFYTRFLELHRDGFAFSKHSMLPFLPGMYFHLIQISDK